MSSRENEKPEVLAFRIGAVLGVAASVLAASTLGCGRAPSGLMGALNPDCNDVARCTPDPNGVCQHTCTADPAPTLVDCAAAEGDLEFFAFNSQPIWDFETPNATTMYSYTDNSQPIITFRQYDDQGSAVAGHPVYARKTWEPPTAPIGRCASPRNPSNRAIHVQGGPFLAWGGGVGKAMKDYKGMNSPVTPEDAELDVSAWEGVSLWARRGPDSQAGFRVLVGDKYTDDDISYLMYRNDPTQPRFCERVRECACLNHQACSPHTLQRASATDLTIINPEIPSECRSSTHPPPRSVTEMTFCGTPHAMSGGELGSAAGVATQCNTCQKSRCDEAYPAYPDDPTPGGTTAASRAGIPQGTDLQFYGKPCSPYTLRSGISTYYCFDPAAGEHPAESTEQCGDHWTKTITLSNEWQFFTVPFDSMLQQGWSKRSNQLDLTAVSTLRFTWDGGWIDFWIDDVRFYRHRK